MGRVGSALLVTVRVGHDLQPGPAGLLDGGDDLFPSLVGRLGRRLQLLTAVAALDGHAEGPAQCR